MRFVADGDATVSGEPGDGAFDFRAVPAEAFAGVDSTLGDAGVMPRSRSKSRCVSVAVGPAGLPADVRAGLGPGG